MFFHSVEEKRLEKKRAKRLMMTAALLTDEEKFSPQGYWKLKKSVSRNIPQKITSVIRPDELVVTGEDLIKDEFKKEFEYRLRNRTPHAEWENYTKNINETLEIIMELSRDWEDTPEFTMAELRKALRKLKRGKSSGYDGLPAEVFLEAG